MPEIMKDSTLTRRDDKPPQNGRWLYILILLGVMHILMDARYRIVHLFPSKAFGFAILGMLYLALSVILTFTHPRPHALFRHLSRLIQSALSPLQKVGRRWLVPGICGTLLLMILASCLARWFYMTRIPIATHLADMLPLIQQACDGFADGSNPYRTVYKMPWTLPLTFWPGMWLPYLPLRLQGIDIRWLHLVVVVGIAAVFCVLILRCVLERNWSLMTTFPATFIALFLFLFSTEPIFFAGIGHTPPQWAWIALLCAAILARRPYLTAVTLGLLLATRQTAVVFAPLIAIYWLRSSASWRTTLKLTVVTCATFLVICGYFLLTAPYEFTIAPLKHYASLGDWDFTRGSASFSADTIGLAFPLRTMQGKCLLSVSMLLAIFLPITSAWRRLRDETDLILYMSLATVAVTLVSPIPWHYEYFPALLLTSFAAISAARQEDIQCDRDREPHR